MPRQPQGLGIPASIGASRYLESMLFGVSVLSPAALCAAAITLLASAFMATIIPAHRALRVDPLVALRVE